MAASMRVISCLSLPLRRRLDVLLGAAYAPDLSSAYSSAATPPQCSEAPGLTLTGAASALDAASGRDRHGPSNQPQASTSGRLTGDAASGRRSSPLHALSSGHSSSRQAALARWPQRQLHASPFHHHHHTARRSMATDSHQAWVPPQGGAGDGAALAEAEQQQQQEGEEGGPEQELVAAMYEEVDSAASLAPGLSLPALQAACDKYYDTLDTSLIARVLDRITAFTGAERAANRAAETELLATVSARYLELLGSMDPTLGVQLLHSFANLRHAPGGEQGMAQVAATVADLWLVPLSAPAAGTGLVDLLWALGKLRHHDEELNMKMGRLMTPKVKVMPMRYLSKLADACAKHNLFMYTLLSEVVNHAKPKVQDMPAGSITTLICALGKQKQQVPELTDAVVDCVVRRLKDFSPTQLVDLLRGFQQMKYTNPEMLDAVAKHAIRTVASYQPRQVANMAYTYACAKHYDEDLCNALAMRAINVMDRFEARHVSNLIYSMARLDHRHVMLLDKAAWHMMRTLSSFTIQNLANSMWGFSKLRKEGAAMPPHLATLYGKVAVIIKDLLRTCDSEVFFRQNYADLLYAFASVRHEDPELYRLLSERVLPVLGQLNVRALVQVPVSLAMVGIYDEALFYAIELRVTALMQDYGPDYLSQLLWAFAVAGHQTSDGTLYEENGDLKPDFLRMAAQQVELKWDRVLNTTGASQAALIWAFLKMDFIKRCPEHGIWKLFKAALPESFPLDGQASAAPAPGELGGGAEGEGEDAPAEQEQEAEARAR